MQVHAASPSSLPAYIFNLESPPFASGGSAEIFKAEFLTNGDHYVNHKVALKVIRTHAAEGKVSQLETLMRRIKRERQILDELRHPNVLHYFGWCEITKDHGIPNTGNTVGVVLSFCGGGTINAYIRHNPSVNVNFLLAQGAAAIHYIHSRNPPIIHGDIKGENFLVDDNGTVKLSDFGLSRIVGVRGYTTVSECASMRWTAIEILRGDDVEHENKDAFSHKRTWASDIWAYGMTILEVLTGELPFSEVPANQDITLVYKIASQNKRPRRPHSSLITDTIWWLLEACWKTESDNRPSAASIAFVMSLIYRFEENLGLSSDSFATLLRCLEDKTPVNAPSHATSPSNEERQHPFYLCKWPGCTKTFEKITESIAHDCSEFLDHLEKIYIH